MIVGEYSTLSCSNPLCPPKDLLSSCISTTSRYIIMTNGRKWTVQDKEDLAAWWSCHLDLKPYSVSRKLARADWHTSHSIQSLLSKTPTIRARAEQIAAGRERDERSAAVSLGKTTPAVDAEDVTRRARREELPASLFPDPQSPRARAPGFKASDRKEMLAALSQHCAGWSEQRLSHLDRASDLPKAFWQAIASESVHDEAAWRKHFAKDAERYRNALVMLLMRDADERSGGHTTDSYDSSPLPFQINHKTPTPRNPDAVAVSIASTRDASTENGNDIDSNNTENDHA